MLKQTLDAVSRLNYPNFECVVIINNTPDPAFWQPIQDHCRALGERFIFINAEKVEGFKAGALRLAMARTAADAEIIGVIDADYVVQSGLAEGSGAGLRRSARRPRAGAAGSSRRRPLADALRHERRICRLLRHRHGRAQRANAIIVHGTMCLIRRAAMDMAGGWASDTICEDTDLGLAHHRARLAHALHQHALRPRPAARHLRGLQEAAAPLGLWRLPDRQEALAPLPAGREPADAGAEARILARLAELARRGKPRRGGGDPQPDLGADRRLCRHRHPRQDPHPADHRRVRCVAARTSSRSTACACR